MSRFIAGIDVRSIDSLIHADDDIDIGLSTLPNQFCSKHDASELRKLILANSQSNQQQYVHHSQQPVSAYTSYSIFYFSMYF